MLKRSPRFLRVAIKGFSVDALDQPEDTPHAAEKLFAYRTDGPTGSMHINMGRGRGGFYPMCSYRLCAEQPTDEQMRNSVKWRAWVEAVAKAEGLTAGS